MVRLNLTSSGAKKIKEQTGGILPLGARVAERPLSDLVYAPKPAVYTVSPIPKPIITPKLTPIPTPMSAPMPVSSPVIPPIVTQPKPITTPALTAPIIKPPVIQPTPEPIATPAPIITPATAKQMSPINEEDTLDLSAFSFEEKLALRQMIKDLQFSKTGARVNIN